MYESSLLRRWFLPLVILSVGVGWLTLTGCSERTERTTDRPRVEREFLSDRVIRIEKTPDGVDEIVFALSARRYRAADDKVLAAARAFAGTGQRVRATIELTNFPKTKSPDAIVGDPAVVVAVEAQP